MPYPEIWLNELGKRGLPSHDYGLVGVTPIKSLKMVTFIHNEVPGVQIPDTVLSRLQFAHAGGLV